MQTWAKRGVRAALVTGGVLAVGTTMAAAEGTSPADRSGDGPTGNGGFGAHDRWSTTERGDSGLSALDVDDARAPRAGGEPSLAHPRSGADGRYRALVFTGRIDPVRDLLPAIEHDATQEIPALREQSWLPPRAHRAPELQLAGWVADPATARPAPGPGRHSRQPGERRHGMRTPSEGFHRSLSWAGPIGEIIRNEHGRPVDPVVETANELITPDPAVLGQEDGLLALWQRTGEQAPAAERVAEPAAGQPADLLFEPAAEQPPAGLLDASVDLTSGALAGPSYRLHTVPGSLLQVALDERPHEPVRHESVPLQLPGDDQLAAHEPPTLREPITAEPTPSAAPRDVRPGVQAPLPLLGELNAFADDQLSGPTFGRLTEAVGQAVPALNPEPRAERAEHAPATVPFAPLRFARDLNRLPVEITEPDPLHALVAERDVVASNPFPAPRAAGPGGGMELPVLGVPVPSLSAVQGHTLPVPGITSDHGARNADDTVEFQRV